MAESGVIEPNSSPWAKFTDLVKKKDGPWYFCADYRLLNKITHKDSYPLPRDEDALDHM